MPTPLDFYSAKIKEYDDNIRTLKKKLRIVSAFRLLLFILLAYAVYRQISLPAGIPAFVIPLLLIAFIVFIKTSFLLSSRKKLMEQLLFVNKNEAGVISGKTNGFPNGRNAPGDAIYKDDLDIAGERSLYHLLNRTTTSHGAEALSLLLNQPATKEETIRDRQIAIRQLATQHDTRQLLTGQGLLNNEKEGNIHDLTSWMETPQRLAGKPWLTAARYILPAYNVAALLYYLDADNPIPIGMGVLASWLFIGCFFKYIMQQHGLTSKKQSILEQYGSIMRTFSQAESGGSSLLVKMKAVSETAYKELIRLSKLTGLFDQRLNLLVGTLLNSLFLYDLHCLAALEKWKGRNKTSFREWITGVGDIEAINSLAVFAFNNPSYCYPDIVAGRPGKPMISATQLAHPLIPGGVAPVANDITAGYKEKLLLITGSNMSGKSTFLRTIGVNLILAQCGAPVYARSFSFTPMQILSSIRISDSLQDNTSYFMAELKRLQQIIVTLKSGAPALVLIDEVLRGTNSDDKTHGSEAFIKKLLGYDCLSFFATHDLSLSALENSYPAEVGNYCFESSIVNGELLFDYTLRPGVAKNKNASFLMQKMEII